MSKKGKKKRKLNNLVAKHMWQKSVPYVDRKKRKKKGYHKHKGDDV